MNKLKKPQKQIVQENGTIDLYTNYGWREIEYHHVPDWNQEDNETEPSFKYKGDRYFLSEFMNIHNKVHQPNPPKWMLEFDGYLSDTFFSGLLIKFNEYSDSVQVWMYLS